jgi:hypothetical protein
MTLLFQQRFVIRYYCLRRKTNAQIAIKLEQGYHQEALRLRAVETWAARFREGWETIEDNERPVMPQNDLGDAVRRFLENHPHSSSREMSKAIYSQRTTILRVLDDLGLRFFPRAGYSIACPMRSRLIGSSFLNIDSI